MLRIFDVLGRIHLWLLHYQYSFAAMHAKNHCAGDRGYNRNLPKILCYILYRHQEISATIRNIRSGKL